MKSRPGLVIAALCAVSAALVTTLLMAGPLDPPAGPVASSYKTLAEVEPRIAINSVNTPGGATTLHIISQPGSYYLTGNITTNKIGIEITTSNVSIDLNGFALIGAGSSFAVFGNGAATNVSIRNGSIKSWGSGLVLQATNNVIVENVTVDSCSSTGISAQLGAVVRDCTVIGGGRGISVANGGVIIGCSVRDNSGDGFDGGQASHISGCTAISNGGSGIKIAFKGTVLDCVSRLNTLHGITVGEGCTVTRCAANDNSQRGIAVTSDCHVSECTVRNNGGGGIVTTFNCTVQDCTAGTNTMHGISVTDGCTVTGCVAANNTLRGITANNGCLVTGCQTRTNQTDGIFVNFSCDVRDNNCNGDGTAAGNHGGVRVIGQANRIEGNNITFGDRGVMVEASGNTVMRNSAKGCAVNYEIVGGNDVGPIGTAATSTSPWANIQF